MDSASRICIFKLVIKAYSSFLLVLHIVPLKVLTKGMNIMHFKSAKELGTCRHLVVMLDTINDDHA